MRGGQAYLKTGTDMNYQKAVKNSFFSVLAQFVIIVMGFCTSRVLNHHMGEALVGANGVIANVLGILSVSELGFSTAVVYHLYRVVRDRDEEKIAALMNLYRKAYQAVAGVILLSGLCLVPFIHRFMKNSPFSAGYVRVLFLLWLCRTVINYLLSYRRSILIADQREYVVSILVLVSYTLNAVLIIVLVLLTENYLLALGSNIVCESLLSILLNGYVDRQYPFLRKYRALRIDREQWERIFADMKNIFFSKLSLKVFTSTDNLIVSGLIGVAVNGLYSNYVMISSSVINVVVAAGNSLQPTVANIFLDQDLEKDHDVLRQISFLFFWIASFSSAALISLLTPFVRELWLGEAYVLDRAVVTAIVASTAVIIIGYPLSAVLAAGGLFRIERNISLAASLLNLGLSLLLAKPLGLIGVILGTIAAHLFCLVARARCFFKDFLERSIRPYALEMLSYFLLVILESVLTSAVTDRIYLTPGPWSFWESCLCCVLIPNGINLLLFFRSKRFRSVLQMVLRR